MRQYQYPFILMNRTVAETGLVLVRVNQTIGARIEEYANIPADIVEQHPSLVISPQFRRQGNGASVTEEVSIRCPIEKTHTPQGPYRRRCRDLHRLGDAPSGMVLRPPAHRTAFQPVMAGEMQIIKLRM